MKLSKHSIIIFTIFLLVATLFAGSLPASQAAAGPLPPKNIIVMIADGTGFNQDIATIYYTLGMPDRLAKHRFPFKLAMSTYAAADKMGAPADDPCVGWGYDPVKAWSDFSYVTKCYTDSSAAATAMATGVKTYNSAIGVDLYGNPVMNVLEAAEAKGKSTGVITTVEFSHATPASFVAHNIDRNDYANIAKEMIYQSAADVIMGAGHPWFDNSGNPVSTPNTFKYVGNEATWNDLVAGVAGGDANGDGIADPWKLIQTRSEFQALAHGDTPPRVVAVAQAYTTLQQARGGDAYADPYVVPLNQNVPTLAEMSKAALNVLDNDPDGLFLMIEGGAVDWAAHSNQSGRTIEEAIDFYNAVDVVVDWVRNNSNWRETLLIVTGDHETGYLWGPGSDPTWKPIVNYGAGVLPGMEWHSPNHTNSLIPFQANGADAQMFSQLAVNVDPIRGRYIDNTDIAKVIFKVLGR